LLHDSFDVNHIDCGPVCPCNKEAARRMARTILMVQDWVKKFSCALEVVKLGEQITKSLEEE
jgi:hypothetical protein